MADARDFLVPDLGEGLESVEVVRWLVAPGERVVVNQLLVEVETAKANVLLPSPFAGVVERLHADVGAEVAVGKPLVTFRLDAPAALPQPAASGPTAGMAAAPAASTASSESAPLAAPAAPAAASAPDTNAPSAVAPVAETRSTESGEEASGSVLVGYGTGVGVRSRRRRVRFDPELFGLLPSNGSAASESNAASTAPSAWTDGPPLAKPPVRRLARELAVDLALVRGSGPRGLITRADVEAVAGMAVGQHVDPSPFAVPVGRTAGDKPPRYGREHAAGERIPIRGVRRAVVELVTRSRREIPEASTWVDVDATELWALRVLLNEQQTDVHVNPLALILRICVVGLQRFPILNARLDVEAQEIILQPDIHLGFAAQTGRGLVVPVIRDAHTRPTLGLAAELQRLTVAARDGTLTPAELTHGTFTVSNYGTFGVDGGSPIINHPQVAILGVGRIADKPWVVGGTLQVRKVVQLALSFDHRVCDGGEAGGFLRYVADLVESPARLIGAV